MSTNGRGAPDQGGRRSGVAVGEAERGSGVPWTLMDNGRGDGHPYAAGGSGAGGRKRRRRGRWQGGKRGGGVRQSHARASSVVSREGIFQELEGLLRQIREQADESPTSSEAQLNEIVHTVTSFTKSLEEQADPISERARG